MDLEREHYLVDDIKKYITEYLPLSKMSDEELNEEIQRIVTEKTENEYISIEDKVNIVRKIYSSIRGLGILDTILADDNITEVMINGKDNIFIEKKRKN